MKVLFLPGYRYPASLKEPLICGDLRYSFNLSRALARAGVDVTVVSRRRENDSESHELDGVRIERYRPELGAVFSTSFDISAARFRRFRALARESDLLIANSPLSLELLGPPNRPLFYVCSGIEDVRNYGSSAREWMQRAGILLLRDPARRLSWQLADRVNTTAEGEVDVLLRRGVPRNKITTIGPGVEIDRYRPAPPAATRALKDMLLPPAAASRRVVLSVSRFSPAKGLLETVRAFARLRATHPDAFLLLVGVRHSHRSDYLERVRGAISSMGLEHDVAIRESVPESVLPVFYSAADVTSVFSIGYDPLPTVMIESMACGTPVVATEMPTRAQVITNGENGLMVPENDEGAWVAAVERLIADARFAERIREAALARVRERFDMDRVAAQYLELYRSL